MKEEQDVTKAAEGPGQDVKGRPPTLSETVNAVIEHCGLDPQDVRGYQVSPSEVTFEVMVHDSRGRKMRWKDDVVSVFLTKHLRAGRWE